MFTEVLYFWEMSLFFTWAPIYCPIHVSYFHLHHQNFLLAYISSIHESSLFNHEREILTSMHDKRVSVYVKSERYLVTFGLYLSYSTPCSLNEATVIPSPFTKLQCQL